MTQQTNPPEGDLVHYGVKGMHWGVRKSTPTNSDYNRSQRNYDRKNVGKGGVKRINRRMNKGADIKTARRQEYKFRRRRNNAIAAGALGVKFHREIAAGIKVTSTILGMAAGIAAQHVAVKAETKRGQAFVAEQMGLPRKPTNGPAYSKKSRGGAHKITSL